MTPATVTELALFAAVVLLLGAAAVRDLRDYLIPDTIPLALAALFGLHVALGGVDWTGALLVAAIVFAVGAVMFARGWLGGGDVKLLTALSLWAGPALLAPMILIVALTGGLHGLLILAQQHRARRLAPADGIAGAAVPSRIPYAVPVLAGGLYVAAMLARGVI